MSGGRVNENQTEKPEHNHAVGACGKQLMHVLIQGAREVVKALESNSKEGIKTSDATSHIFGQISLHGGNPRTRSTRIPPKDHGSAGQGEAAYSPGTEKPDDGKPVPPQKKPDHAQIDGKEAMGMMAEAVLLGSHIDRDANGRIVAVTHLDGSRVLYGYDSAGRLCLRQDNHEIWKSEDGGRTWRDQSGKQYQLEISVDKEGIEHRHYPDGRQESRLLDGTIITTDNQHRTSTVFPDRSELDQVEGGRVVRVKRANGVEITYGYDDHGKLNSWVGPEGEWKSNDGGKSWSGPFGVTSDVTTTVDTFGNEHREYRDGTRAIYRLDGTVISRAKDESSITIYPDRSSVNRDSNGHIIQVRHPDGSQVNYGYDRTGRLNCREDSHGRWVTSDGQSWTCNNHTVDMQISIDLEGGEHRRYANGDSRDYNRSGVVYSRCSDGAGYTHTPDGAGGYTEVHRRDNLGLGCPRPDEQFAIVGEPDGTIRYAELNEGGKPGRLLELIANDSQVRTERDRLVQLADRKIANPTQLAKFKADMARFEDRSRKIEDLYLRQGKTVDEARQLAHDQVRRSYRQLRRLLEAGDNPQVGFDESQRVEIAEQVMAHAATLTLVGQGGRGTCNVSDIESRTYTRNPSEAIRLVVEVSTTGRYETTDSKGPPRRDRPVMVTIDKCSLAPDDDSRKSNPPTDGSRGLASQIFQITAVNIGYKLKDPTGKTRYEQRGDGQDRPTPSPPDAVWDYSRMPPRKVIDGVGDASYANTIAKIGDQINPQDSNYDWILNEGNQFANAGALIKRLKEAKAKGQLPVTIALNANNEPLGSGTPAAGGHVVNITDFIPGDPPKLCYDNTWNSNADHNAPDKAVSVYDFYTAAYDPTAIERIPGLQDAVGYNRKHHIVNSLSESDELNLIRAQKVNGQLDEAACEEQLRERMNAIEKHYKAGRINEEARTRLIRKINEQNIQGSLDWSRQFQMVAYEHSVGVISSDAEYDGFLGDTLVSLRCQHDKLMEQGKLSAKLEEQYAKAMWQYKRLFQQLPIDRQTRMRARVSEAIRKANAERRKQCDKKKSDC